MNFRFSPTWRLTGWYVLIIMVISVMFSTIIYQLTLQQVHLRLPPREHFMREITPRYGLQYDQRIVDLLEDRYRELVVRLRLSLIFLNVVVLAGATVASYFLAKRTLRPIESALADQRHFTADASHELRTPLAAMRAEIEVALKQPDTADHRRVLQSGLEEIAKLEQLSGSLLHLARHEDDRRTPRVEPVDLDGVVAEAVAKIQSKAKQQRMVIERRHVSGHVVGDVQHLTELFVILLDNAIKYSPAGTTIAIQGRRDGQETVVEVIDHGRGINPVDLPHVFKRFYRADGSRTKGETDGFGLGLAIAKQIVERHHGRIAIASTVGHGTTVTVVLPVGH